MEYKYQYNKKICANCGKMGHEFKSCLDPITSYGVINVKVLDDIDIEFCGPIAVDKSPSEKSNIDENNIGELFKSKFSRKKKIKHILTSKKYKYLSCDITNNLNTTDSQLNYQIDNESINYYDMEKQIEKFCYYKNKVLFLMVSRRFSVGFIDFIRGKYSVYDSNSIIKLFEHMTPQEILYIRDHQYDDILCYFLNKHDESREDMLNKIYEGKYSSEYCEARVKFNILVEANGNNEKNIPWNMAFYIMNVKPKWKHPEWGFPKGRRDRNTEENLNCACREFEEETGYKKENYHILNKIEPIEEYLLGTNGVNYKHVYYLSIDTADIGPDKQQFSEFDSHEIGEVRWFTFDEAVKMIRPYHVGKKYVLTRIYMFMINYLLWYDSSLEI